MTKDDSALTHTWDGLLVGQEPPFGATIVVHRRAASGSAFVIPRRAPDWPAYLAEAPAGVAVRLSAEHDADAWLPGARSSSPRRQDISC